MTKKINCGIIGVGWWGSQMSDFILKSGKFNIRVIYDNDTSKTTALSQKFKCNIVNNLDELLSDNNIQYVFIFSPNEFHTEHAILAAKSKKHIFIEKPLANTVIESEKIIEACKENGVILAVGHNVRYYNIFKEAKKIIDGGIIGEIIYIDGNRSRPIGYGIDEKSWRFYSDKCNGGPLIQMAIHIFDTVRFVCGLDTDQIKKISLRQILRTQNDESFAVLLKFNKNKILHVFSSYVAQESFYLNFYGTKGTLFADVFNGLSIQRNGEFKKKKINYRKNSPEIEEVKLFYKSIVEKLEFGNPTVEDAMNNVNLIEKILASD